MKRLISFHLQHWKNDPGRKSLLLRGARQVGKTYSCRELGLIIGETIIPGKTLLFFDEIQDAPKAIQSLRYFQQKRLEKMRRYPSLTG